uniref:Ig-like domain-containing protein n=1 Tax=Strigamia maritima TaxID=126957 RepID=T1J5H8_STRMM
MALQPMPPKFTLLLRDAEVTEGCRFKFQCRVTGYPVPDVQWCKSNVIITNNPDYHITYHDGLCTLTIEETFSEDTAQFTCRAGNCAGIAETKANLTVIELKAREELTPPNFIRKLEPGFAKEGSAFKFECEVTGHPLPVVSWFRDEVCIDNSPNYAIINNNGLCILNFPEVRLVDSAKYTCRASNKAGQATSITRLSVESLEAADPPVFTQPLSNVMARAGQKLRLECQVFGVPEPVLTWTHNNKPIKTCETTK